MQRWKLLPGILVCLLLTGLHGKAQTITGAAYFSGKWKVLLKGLPDGDRTIIFNLQSQDSTLTGSVNDTTGNQITTVTNAELKAEQVTLYFTAEGYDVNLVLNRKDEDHATGTLMGMFEAAGERVKEETTPR